MLPAQAVCTHYELVGGNDIERIIRDAIEREGVTLIEVPVEDSLSIRRGAVVARVRETTRQIVGPHIFGWIRKLWSDSAKAVRAGGSPSDPRAANCSWAQRSSSKLMSVLPRGM